MPKEITNTEAIYSFVSWLTTRSDQITISRHNDSAPALALVERFRKLNGWDPPRENWEDADIKYPSLVD